MKLRNLLNETENAREVIGACAQLKEMLLNRKFTVLAGHQVMSQYMPEVIKLTASRRLAEVKAAEVSTVVVSTVAEKIAMKSMESDIKVLTLEELVLSSLS